MLMSSKKILLVHDRADMGNSYYLPFAIFGERCDDLSILNTNPQSIAFIVFTGGPDISPSLYNENLGSKTRCDNHRDEIETVVFGKAIDNNIPMFGICRGLQFLTVMMGGKLIQHVNHHHRPHFIETKEKLRMVVTSSHHQMVLPEVHDEILAWTSPRLSTLYVDGNDKLHFSPEKEVEAVHFVDFPIAGVQYHPEIMDISSFGFYYVQELVRQYIL